MFVDEQALVGDFRSFVEKATGAEVTYTAAELLDALRQALPGGIPKVRRDAFGYLEPREKEEAFAQCATCALWLKGKERCFLHGAGVKVDEDDACNYYCPGEPMEEGKPLGVLTPEQSGLVGREVGCRHCRFFVGGDRCNLYTELNRAMPTVFQLDVTVHPLACCNANSPADGVENRRSSKSSEKGRAGGKGRFPPGVYLIRHGKTALNKGPGTADSKDRIRGWLDVPLDAEGRKEAKRLGREAPRMHLARVYTSDLQRAAEVAGQMADHAGVPMEASRAFRPWNLGVLQGNSAKAAAPVIREHVEAPDEPVEDGESFHDFLNRYVPALERVLRRHEETGENLAVVTHYRNVKVAEGWLAAGREGIDEETFFTDDLPTGAVVRVYKDGEEWKYERLQWADGDAEEEGRARLSLPLVRMARGAGGIPGVEEIPGLGHVAKQPPSVRSASGGPVFHAIHPTSKQVVGVHGSREEAVQRLHDIEAASKAGYRVERKGREFVSSGPRVGGLDTHRSEWEAWEKVLEHHRKARAAADPEASMTAEQHFQRANELAQSARKAKTPEEKQRFEGEAQRHLELHRQKSAAPAPAPPETEAPRPPASEPSPPPAPPPPEAAPKPPARPKQPAAPKKPRAAAPKQPRTTAATRKPKAPAAPKQPAQPEAPEAAPAAPPHPAVQAVQQQIASGEKDKAEQTIAAAVEQHASDEQKAAVQKTLAGKASPREVEAARAAVHEAVAKSGGEQPAQAAAPAAPEKPTPPRKNAAASVAREARERAAAPEAQPVPAPPQAEAPQTQAGRPAEVEPPPAEQAAAPAPEQPSAPTRTQGTARSAPSATIAPSGETSGRGGSAPTMLAPGEQPKGAPAQPVSPSGVGGAAASEPKEAPQAPAPEAAAPPPQPPPAPQPLTPEEQRRKEELEAQMEAGPDRGGIDETHPDAARLEELRAKETAYQQHFQHPEGPAAPQAAAPSSGATPEQLDKLRDYIKRTYGTDAVPRDMGSAYALAQELQSRKDRGELTPEQAKAEFASRLKGLREVEHKAAMAEAGQPAPETPPGAAPEPAPAPKPPPTPRWLPEDIRRLQELMRRHKLSDKEMAELDGLKQRLEGARPQGVEQANAELAKVPIQQVPVKADKIANGAIQDKAHANVPEHEIKRYADHLADALKHKIDQWGPAKTLMILGGILLGAYFLKKKGLLAPAGLLAAAGLYLHYRQWTRARNEPLDVLPADEKEVRQEAGKVLDALPATQPGKTKDLPTAEPAGANPPPPPPPPEAPPPAAAAPQPKPPTPPAPVAAAKPTPEQFARTRQAVYQLHPQLRVLGDNLNVENHTDPGVQRSLKALAGVPQPLLQKVAAHVKGGIYLSSGRAMPDVDDLGWLRSQPRTQNGGSWENSHGLYSPTKKILAVARHDRRDRPTVLHELGHAIGDATGHRESPAMQEHHRRLAAAGKLSPYFLGGGPGSRRGTSETFAEGVALMLSKGKKAVAQKFDPQYAAWLENELRNVR